MSGGLWIEGDHADDMEKPDLVVYYLHGGGFSMGSSYFYLEFLISWLTLLRQRGFKYPAIFALEYSLVPDQVFPRAARRDPGWLQVPLRISRYRIDHLCEWRLSWGDPHLKPPLIERGIKIWREGLCAIPRAGDTIVSLDASHLKAKSEHLKRLFRL